MKKYLYLLPFLLGIACFILFTIIGSYVDQDGTLIEPFFLIPIGYLWVFIGLVFILFRYLRHFVKNHKNR
jgi:TRAP-type C4-dicarboxylate transport system permease small subunit